MKQARQETEFSPSFFFFPFISSSISSCSTSRSFTFLVLSWKGELQGERTDHYHSQVGSQYIQQYGAGSRPPTPREATLVSWGG